MYGDTSGTVGITDNYSISKYLNSLLDEELYLLLKINYNKEIKVNIVNTEFKKLLEKVAEYSNNRNNIAIIICETSQHIEKEVIKRWIKYKKERRVK